ncbi:interleukin-2 receptor subunit alpha [Capricornis sumatraensis]|uniref:interleukin-2 receptor subunit alpha n=1 Tax=Capricornis sumatraensis TaxID=34865 RepID=UPI0036053A48
MAPSLLMWGFFAFIVVPGCVTEACHDDPPRLRNAMFKALRYEVGTMINCDCKAGFRRVSAVMRCVGDSSHSAWSNRCFCNSTSPAKNPVKQVTPGSKEQRERKPTDAQSQTQPPEQADLPGHCEEPPPWAHELEPLKRVYHFTLGQTVHYQCAQGFRALHTGPAESTCTMIHGEMRWTRPRLKCISEGANSQAPDEAEPLESTEAPPGSGTFLTTRTAGTTDSQKPTDVVATLDTFIFTTEYQIAVAGCILLLSSVLLLSCLTWQRRWKKNRRTI